MKWIICVILSFAVIPLPAQNLKKISPHVGQTSIFNLFESLSSLSQLQSFTDLLLGLRTQPQITADFTFTPDSACSGTSIRFVASASGGVPPYTYDWRFGDGGKSTLSSDIHSFTVLGCGVATLQDTLIIKDAAGAGDTIIHPVHILRAPDVQISDKNTTAFPALSNCNNSPTPASPNYTLTINNASPSTACISSYTIDWGDSFSQTGLTAASFPLTHTYTSLGAFNLVVTARGSNGCTNSRTYPVYNQSNPAVGIKGPGSTSGCAPAGFWFKLSQYELNSPGTFYVWDFGDNTPRVTWNSPVAVDSIFHVFNSSSCTQAGNQFTVKVTAKNGCDSTSATVNNVRIYSKPLAGFSSLLSACTNTPLTFTNTSLLAYNQGSCNRVTTYRWDFGDPASAQNTSTIASPTHTFSVPGTYRVSLIANGTCGDDTITKAICITSPPLTKFSITDSSGCAPFTVNTKNLSDSGSCLPVKFLWKVTYTPGFCGTTQSVSFAPGSTDSSTNPVFIFKNAGTYVISLQTVTPCQSGSFTKTVTVKQQPVISLPPDTIACGAVTFNQRITLPLCKADTLLYAWTFQGGNPAISIDSNPKNISFSDTGRHLILLKATNACGDTTATRILTIKDVTTSVAGPDQNICGTVATMAANTPVAGTGAWSKVSGPGTPVITTSSSATTTVTGLTTGSYVFRWTITNATCTSISDVNINVSTAGNAASAGPDQNLCSVVSVTLAGNNPAPGTGAWNLVSGPNTPIFANLTSPTTTVTGLVPGIYVFKWTVLNGTCPPGSDDVQVTVSNNATVADAGPSQNICGTTATMAANTPASGTGQWTRVSGPNTPVITVSSAPTTTITGLVAGTYVFKWTVTNGACASSSNMTLTISNGVGSVSAGPDQSLCQANSVTLAGNTPAIGTGIWTYVSGPAAPTITSPALPATTVTGLVPGTYVFRWTISSGSCTPASDDVQVIISNGAAADAGADQTICTTTTTMAAVGPVTGSGLWTWVSGPNSPIISNPSSPSTTITGMAPGIYIFKWTVKSGVCPPVEDLVQVTVAGAALATAGPDQTLCSGTSATLAANVPTNGTGRWTLVSGPGTPVITTASSPSTTVTGLIAGVYTFRWTVTNGTCPAGSDDVQITRLSLAASFSPQGLVTCKTDTAITFNNATVYTGTDQLQYKWLVDNLVVATTKNCAYRYTLPPGATLPRVFNTWLIAYNTSGCADTTKGAVTMQQSVTAFFDLVNSNTCAPFTVKVNNTSLNATSYRWLLNGAQVSTLPSPQIELGQPSTSYTVALIADNALACRPDTFVRTFVTPPKPKAGFSLNDSLGCNGSLSLATRNLSTGATVYSWIWGDGTPPSAFTSPTHVYSSPGDYSLVLVASNGTCNDTALSHIRIATKLVVDFSADKTIGCDSTRVSFTNLSRPVGRASWDFGDGTFSTAINPVKQFAPRAAPYTIKLLNVDTAGCKDSIIKANLIRAISPPVASFLVSPRTIIEAPDYTFSFINTTARDTGYQYTWNFGDSSFPVSARDASHRYANTGKYLVSLTIFDPNSNCSKTVLQEVQITGVEGYLYVPNAFQPGNTNPLLRTFLPVGKNLCSYRLQIFTSWGQKVFETTSLDGRGVPNEGWNGQYNGNNNYNQGKAVQQDSYTWRIDAFFKNGTDCKNAIEWKGMKYPNEPQLKRVGTITLIR